MPNSNIFNIWAHIQCVADKSNTFRIRWATGRMAGASARTSKRSPSWSTLSFYPPSRSLGASPAKGTPCHRSSSPRAEGHCRDLPGRAEGCDKALAGRNRCLTLKEEGEVIVLPVIRGYFETQDDFDSHYQSYPGLFGLGTLIRLLHSWLLLNFVLMSCWVQLGLK